MGRVNNRMCVEVVMAAQNDINHARWQLFRQLVVVRFSLVGDGDD